MNSRRDGKSACADVRHGEAVGQGGVAMDANGRAMGLGGGELGGAFGLDAENRDLRPQCLDGKRDPGEESGAADGNDDGFDVGHLFEDFQSHRALAGDDGGIVVTVNVGEAAFGGQRAGVFHRFEEAAAVEHDVGAEAAAGVALDEGRKAGHDHGDGDAEQAAVVGEAERVVAGGGRDDSARFLRAVEEEQGVARAAFLEGAGALKIFEFAEDAHAGDFRERNRFRAGGGVDGAGDAGPRGLDIGEGDGGHGRRGGRGNPARVPAKRARLAEARYPGTGVGWDSRT